MGNMNDPAGTIKKVNGDNDMRGIVIFSTQGIDPELFQKMVLALYNGNEKITAIYSCDSPSCENIMNWSEHVFNVNDAVSNGQLLIDKKAVCIPSLTLSDAVSLSNLDSAHNFVSTAVAAVGASVPVYVSLKEGEFTNSAMLKEINSVKNKIASLGINVLTSMKMALTLDIRGFEDMELTPQIIIKEAGEAKETKAEVINEAENTEEVKQEGAAMDFSKYIDHTYLKPQGTYDDIDKLCKEAAEHSFKAVCVNPVHVKRAKKELEGTEVLVATVIGFPLGANISEVKAFETNKAIGDGADEIDMVLNVGAMKSGDHELVEKDIRMVVEAAAGKTVKVILETCLLTDEEKIKASLLSRRAGAHFVKTSTGFSTGGATFEDVYLMKQTVGDSMEVKASGGVRDVETAAEMIKLGATRLGTSSGLKIVSGEKGGSNDAY